MSETLEGLSSHAVNHELLQLCTVGFTQCSGCLVWLPFEHIVDSHKMKGSIAAYLQLNKSVITYTDTEPYLAGENV